MLDLFVLIHGLNDLFGTALKPVCCQAHRQANVLQMRFDSRLVFFAAKPAHGETKGAPMPIATPRHAQALPIIACDALERMAKSMAKVEERVHLLIFVPRDNRRLRPAARRNRMNALAAAAKTRANALPAKQKIRRREEHI